MFYSSLTVFFSTLLCGVSSFSTQRSSKINFGKSNLHMADIVDTAVSAGSFKTLAAALGASGLVSTLKGPGPFTVFAPTDDAFAKLPSGTVEALLKDIPTLTKILTFHVVSGKMMSPDVVSMGNQGIKTVNGDDVRVVMGNKGMSDAYVKINDAKIVKADIACDNGVIHVIDSVLLPSAAKGAAVEVFNVKNEAGISGPFGFFDPIGLCPKDEKNFRKYRESELKHGRISMLAFLGCLVGESGLNFFGSGDPANPIISGPAIYQYQQAEQILGPYGSWSANVVGLILAVEGYNIVKGWEPYTETFADASAGIAGLRSDYVNGDLGFDPFGFKPMQPEKLREMQTKELNNGRLAMLGIAGFVVQELITQESIF